MTKTGLALLALALLARPALPYHRQTAPIVAVTSSGDTPLPRLPAAGRRLAIATAGNQIFRQDRGHNLLEKITNGGGNANPTISASANTVAWDTDCSQFPGCMGPGRQVFLWLRGTTFQAVVDPSGTSANPALSGKGTTLAFESNGDLDPAQANPTGARQVFLRANNGVITQASWGKGTSGNPSFDRSGHRLVFDSTSDLAGNNTQIAQIWLRSPVGISPKVLTAGLGSSRRPVISSDGHLVAFESTADLTGNGSDTRVSQIFVYEVAKGTVTKVTSDTSGCSGASVSAVPADMSVGYVCNGKGFFYHLLTKHHFALPINGGNTIQAVAELGGHFMVVSTTSNMLGQVGTTTSGHQVYMLNLFKLAATPID